MTDEPPGHETKGKSKEPASDRTRLIEAITSPLNFFALCVTACEAILGLTTAGLSEQHRFIIVWVMAGLLAILIAVVAALTTWKPRHVSPEMANALEKSEEARLAAQQALLSAKESEDIFASTSFQTKVEEILDRHMEAILKEHSNEQRGE